MAWGCGTQECFQGLHESCGDAPLPYRTVAWWVKAFWEGRDTIQDNLCTGQPHVEHNTDQLLASLLDADCRWTTYELAAKVRVLCHKTILHILPDTVNLQCVGYLMKFLRCNNGTTMQSHRPYWSGTKGKVMTFFTGVQHYSRPLINHLFPNVWKTSYTSSTSIFCWSSVLTTL